MKIQHFFQTRITFLFILTSFIAPLSYLSTFVPTHKHIEFPSFFAFTEIFSHFQFLYLIFGFFCFFYIKTLKINIKIILFTIISFPFFMGYYKNYHYDSYYIYGKKIEQKKETLNIIFANVHFTTNNIGKIEEIIKEDNVDIIALVETSKLIDDNLMQISKKYNFEIIKEYSHNGFGYSLLFKKYLNFKKPLTTMPQDTISFYGVKNNKKIAFNLIHYTPPMNTELKKMRDIATIQTYEIIKKQQEENYDFVILAGDFNSTIWSTTTNLFHKINMKSTTNFKPTWPSIPYFPGIGIDHLYINDKLHIEKTIVLNQKNGSDHKAIYNKILLK